MALTKRVFGIVCRNDCGSDPDREWKVGVGRTPSGGWKVWYRGQGEGCLGESNLTRYFASEEEAVKYLSSL